MPAYNEERTIHAILDRIRAVELVGGMTKELIITNDCSTDDTEGAILRYQNAHPELPIRYFKHAIN